MRNAVFGFIALLFVGGCASTELCPQTSGDTPLDHITLRYPGNFDQIALEGGRMFGPELEVMRYDDAYRGFAFRKAIDLRVQEDLIEGAVGAARTELHVERYPDGFHLQGLYAGNLSALSFRRDRLEGQLGGRVFRLRSSAVDPLVYESNSGPAEQAVPVPRRAIAKIHSGPTEIVLPTRFGSLPMEHQAAVLAIFLGR
jgi:hypothetical protein